MGDGALSVKLADMANRFVENFIFSHQQHVNWQVDRPLIDAVNHSGIEGDLKLLLGEIEELNGGDKLGIFSKENIKKNPDVREDYRQQEISDIIVFAMTTFDELGVKISWENIEVEIDCLMVEYGFSAPPENMVMGKPPALDAAGNEIYLKLRGFLNDEAQILKDFGAKNLEQLPRILEKILVYCVAMHSLIGVDSAAAVLEKVARNMIKYPAALFALTAEEKLLPIEVLQVRYDLLRAACAADFDGAKDPETGARPKTGTGKFYGENKLPEADLADGETRKIGILYRAAAALIAKGYERFPAKYKKLKAGQWAQVAA